MPDRKNKTSRSRSSPVPPTVDQAPAWGIALVGAAIDVTPLAAPVVQRATPRPRGGQRADYTLPPRATPSKSGHGSAGAPGPDPPTRPPPRPGTRRPRRVT